jgi:cytidylate kinase
MPVITVSGGLASGAREIAQLAAERLGLEYVDQEILVEAARELGVSVDAMASRDERPSSIGERVGAALRSLMERSAAAGGMDPIEGGGLEMVLARTYGEAAELPAEGERGQLDDARYLKTLASVMKSVAARGNVVILGRGSHAILQHDPDVVHVYIHAPKKQRIETLAARDAIAEPEAERRIRDSDENRRAFHRRYFKVDVDNLSLYHLSINAGRVTHESAVDLIGGLARAHTPRPG